jgi:hypothetical protein
VTQPTPDLPAIARAFDIPGEFLSAVPTGSGHINDSYCATFQAAGQPSRTILQRINHHIFGDPAALMQNIQRVTSHVATKLAAEPDSHRRTLTLIPARDSRAWHTDPLGSHFIEQARTYDIIESPAQAYQAARAFGHFQCLLADLPAPRLHDTMSPKSKGARPGMTVSRSMTQRPSPVRSSSITLLNLVSLWVTRSGSCASRRTLVIAWWPSEQQEDAMHRLVESLENRDPLAHTAKPPA